MINKSLILLCSATVALALPTPTLLDLYWGKSTNDVNGMGFYIISVAPQLYTLTYSNTIVPMTNVNTGAAGTTNLWLDIAMLPTDPCVSYIQFCDGVSTSAYSAPFIIETNSYWPKALPSAPSSVSAHK